MNPAEIPVVILCGGKGTRIRGVSDQSPKPMVPIGPYPILWHIMKLYSAHGFRKFILCLGYKGWDIKEFFTSYRNMTSDLSVQTKSGNVNSVGGVSEEDWEVILAETGLESGTGGRLAEVAKYIDTDYFMCSYGDGIGDLDLTAEIAQLAESDHLGLVCGVHPTSRYGELEANDTGTITGFAEKLPSESWVSGGFFAFRKEFLSYLEDDPNHFFEHGPLQKLTAEGNLGLFTHEGFWMGMDTFREYSALNDMWSSGNATWKTWAD